MAFIYDSPQGTVGLQAQWKLLKFSSLKTIFF